MGTPAFYLTVFLLVVGLAWAKADPDEAGRKEPPPWSGTPPNGEDEVFVFEAEGKRHWSTALAYREWQRWSLFARNGQEHVPVHLDVFPRAVWSEVLKLCVVFGYHCALDSDMADVEQLHLRCACCFGYTRACPRDADFNPEVCDQCVAEGKKMMEHLSLPNRQIMARVTVQKKQQ